MHSFHERKITFYLLARTIDAQNNGYLNREEFYASRQCGGFFSKYLLNCYLLCIVWYLLGSSEVVCLSV